MPVTPECTLKYDRTHGTEEEKRSHGPASCREQSEQKNNTRAQLWRTHTHTHRVHSSYENNPSEVSLTLTHGLLILTNASAVFIMWNSLA